MLKNFFGNFFSKQKNKNLEKYTDEQFLDAMDMLKEGAQVYLELLAKATQENDTETQMRIKEKLNASFGFNIKNWDGEVRMTSSISSVPAGFSGGKFSSNYKRLSLK